jgi:signal transduction histidine kinase
MERQKIGRDLHDDLGPHLIGIEVLNTVLIQKIMDGIIPEAKDIEKIRLLIKDAIEKTRRLARGLCPVHLEDYGLESSLKELSSQVEDIYGIPCSFNYNDFPIIENISVLSNLYYIAHEAVYNAVKHAGAKTISIDLTCNGGIVTLEISDDGRGLSGKKKSDGMGLRIMRHRAQNIGADLDIKSDNKGTTVILAYKILEKRVRNG